MNSNPFQDASVMSARSPTTNISLDPSQVNMAVPPPVASPTPVPSYQHQTGAAVPPSPTPQSAPLGVPPSTGQVPQHNLMDEIGDVIKATNSKTIVRLMRTVNLLLAVATIVAGVLAWIFGRVNSFQKVIAGIYIVMFGFLLLAFELRTDKIDQIFRINFGFMYGNKTRTIFLLFMAIWPLSMGNFWLTILDAALLFVNAFFNYFVISQHPAFTHAGQPAPVAPQQPGMQPQGSFNV